MNIKKIFVLCATVAIIALAAIHVNINYSKSDLSDVSLANIEVLAQNESGGCPDCATYCYWEWCGGIIIGGVYFYLQDCIC